MDAHQLANMIASEARAAHAAPGVMGMAAAPTLGDFCSIWATAKPVLSLIAQFAVFIPGAGATAGAALHGLIKVGDQIASQVCKT